MSDSAASSFFESTPRDDAPVLIGQQELESALDDFRLWFMEAAGQPGGPPSAEMPPTIDLATLLGHFVALRQEINLQTRAVRTQQEQTSEVVGKFQQTLELAQRSQTRAEQAERQNQEDKLRPLLGTLADLYDSLATAAAQIRRVTSGVLPRLQQMHEEAEDDTEQVLPGSASTQARSFWSRWILSPTADDAIKAHEEQARNAHEKMRREREERRLRAEASAEACDQVETALSALLSGYTMNLERIERGLLKYNLEPIEAVGTPFDPDTMESLDAVAGTGRPSNEVVEEVQRGYTLNGKVFRYARVRVARN
jgi:molecular chaperone GrpE